MLTGLFRESTRAVTRKARTPEQALWRLLQSRRLQGQRFLRRGFVGPFEVDFCCPDRLLVLQVAVDHGAFRSRTLEERTRAIEELGFRVLTIWAEDLKRRPDRVLERIVLALSSDR